jgi:hypothetical protein
MTLFATPFSMMFATLYRCVCHSYATVVPFREVLEQASLQAKF